jgi:integrase
MLGDYSLSQLNPMILQQFVNELMDKGLANSSVKRIFSIVFSSLDMAEKMQLISKNYASFVHKPKLRRKELQVWDVKRGLTLLNTRIKRSLYLYGLSSRTLDRHAAR